MRILVTGAAGFMGSHLVDYLISSNVPSEKNHQVAGIDNLLSGSIDYVHPGLAFHEGDLRKPRDVKFVFDTFDPEIVYHLAAYAAEGQSVFVPRFTTNMNYIAFINLINEVINREIKTFVFTSSMSVYGHNIPPMVETDIPRPQDPYAITKWAIEQFLEVYSEEFGFDYVTIRPHNVYGPRQSLTNPYRNVLGIWMNRIMHGKPPIIYGDGEQTRAFTEIDDCIPYIAESAWNRRAQGEIINVGSRTASTLNHMCDLVLDVMDSDLKPIYMAARPLEVKHAWCSTAKSHNLLGYETLVDLKAGLKRMAVWAKSVGPQPFVYWPKEQFEIQRKIPEVWREQML